MRITALRVTAVLPSSRSRGSRRALEGFRPSSTPMARFSEPMTAYRLLQHETTREHDLRSCRSSLAHAFPNLFLGMRGVCDLSKRLRTRECGAQRFVDERAAWLFAFRRKEPRGPRALEQGTRSLSGGPVGRSCCPPFTLPLLGPSRTPCVARDSGVKGRNPFTHHHPAKALVPAPPREGKRAPENRGAFHRCEFARSRGSLQGRTCELASRYAASGLFRGGAHCTRESLRIWDHSDDAWP